MSNDENKYPVDNIDATNEEVLYDDEILFEDEPVAEGAPVESEQTEGWKVLIVDDEKDVHTVTRLALEDFTFKGRPIEFLPAFTASEAKNILNSHSDIGLALVDVVMETNDAGLGLVQFIREELNDNFIQIVLRTGQPGYAPEKDVISQYHINDYKSKTELTTEKLFTLVMSNLRAYDNLITLESFRKDLEKKVEERTHELEEQKEELQKANATKDKFFSILAHDLKNPFAAILGYAELLKDDFDNFTDDEKRHFVNEIYGTSNSTFNLLENLLNWSRSQTGRLTITKKNITLEELIETTIDLMNPIASKKQIEIQKDFKPNDQVSADPFMTTTIIRNLLSNALKFTPVGGKVIVSSSQNDSSMDISIRDFGIGLSKTELGRLFRIDETFTKRGTSDEGGTGLGLILCKEFAEKQEGTILVESEEGKGSVFTLRLPR